MNLLRQAELSMKGRKRHSGVDRQGNLLHITVHKANGTGAGYRVFKEAVQNYPTLKGVCENSIE
ncbi:hypothetical protein HE1_01151 [Holospora elegans E1]|uniref:Transposase n=1 Tax=Holospora elegans E1 TaxID=1427503 RepID=A0A023DZ59_9PROT|nr:hypothetical protein [Holospora elegans]GAJ46809.1 hypothetical protein HE1_01151 [Holospora elegans E1]